MASSQNYRRGRNWQEPMLTSKDLQLLLRVNGRTIARLAAKGGMPRPVKVGRSNRWNARDIRAYLRELSQDDLAQ